VLVDEQYNSTVESAFTKSFVDREDRLHMSLRTWRGLGPVRKLNHLDEKSAFRLCARDTAGFFKAQDGCDTTTELYQPSSRALGLTQTRQRINARGRPRRNQAG